MSDTHRSNAAWESCQEDGDFSRMWQTSQSIERALLSSMALSARHAEESKRHAGDAAILGFQCQRLQEEIRALKKRLATFTDL